MAGSEELRGEVERVRRVADMLTTAHANLCERFNRFALILDLSVLGLSTWLVAVAFVGPRLGVKLTPGQISPQVWSGFLGVGTFFLSLVQLRVDWKGRSDAHRRTFDLYAEVKRECGYLLASGVQLTHDKCGSVLSKYSMATDIGTPIPEREFLRQKKKHLQKIEISRMLDAHPSVSIIGARIRMWWRDNHAGGD
jgi:uncharacterized membrane protein (DUF485 family)